MTDFGDLDHLDDVDAEILTALRAACEAADPVPTGMIERIQFEMSLAVLRAEIAELEAGDLAQVRSDGLAVADTLTFRGSSASLMVRIRRPDAGADATSRLALECWASEPGAGVEVWSNGVLVASAAADDHGRVEFAGIAPGAVRLIVRPIFGPPIATPVVQL
ncbi:MAG: hypothetical protein IPK37_19450 [Austwickia sp.]|nr:MAG: hypothetical protein IPK37_19450 [Austwickia sp.]